MTAGPMPTLLVLKFCVSLIVVLYFWVILFSRVFAFLICGLWVTFLAETSKDLEIILIIIVLSFTNRLSRTSRAFWSFCLTFQFPFRHEVQFYPCEFNYCGRHYCQFVYILCAGWRHPKLFNLGVLSQTFNVLLLVILSFKPVEQ